MVAILLVHKPLYLVKTAIIKTKTLAWISLRLERGHLFRFEIRSGVLP